MATIIVPFALLFTLISCTHGQLCRRSRRAGMCQTYCLSTGREPRQRVNRYLSRASYSRQGSIRAEETNTYQAHPASCLCCSIPAPARSLTPWLPLLLSPQRNGPRHPGNVTWHVEALQLTCAVRACMTVCDGLINDGHNSARPLCAQCYSEHHS